MLLKKTMTAKTFGGSLVGKFARIFILFFAGCWHLLAAEGVPSDFFVVTPEKTGTHLLTKVLTRLFDKECLNDWRHEVSRNELIDLLEFAKKSDMYVQMHALPTATIIELLQELNYKVIFLLRDPRDQALSLLHYIDSGWAYGPLRLDMDYGRLSFSEKLDEIITGKRYGLSATESIIGKRIPWMHEDSSFVLTLFFEDIVGDRGGGSRAKQLQKIQEIVAFLGANLNEEEVDLRSQNLFGKPGEGTFRQGKIGLWRDKFEESHKRAMKVVFGKELVELGYERDEMW